MEKPLSQVWFLCASYKQAKLIAWQEFKRLLPVEALKKKPNDTDLVITLKNGSELYLIGTDEMDSIRGLKPSGVIFEEAAMHKRQVWHEIVRPNLLVHKAPALFISTPNGYNWFKDLEDTARKSIDAGENEWAVFHFTSYDNPYIDFAELEKDRKDCDNERIWRQEYMAEYESSVGRVFSNFNEQKHVGLVPPHDGEWSRGIDWGMRDDTGCVWGYVRGRTLYVKREHSENNLPASAQAAIILGKTDPKENCARSIISHDAAKQDAEMRGLTVQWHFQNGGIRPLKLGSRNKAASRSLLQQLFREDRIVIDKSCEKLRKQLLAYEWKDTIIEAPMSPEDGNDDLVDALHYLAELYAGDLLRREEAHSSVEERIRQARQEMQDHMKRSGRFQLPGSEKESGYTFKTTTGYL